MKDFQKRMLEEHKELQERIMKIDMFLESETFKAMDMVDKADLICQEHAMILYERFLGSRCLKQGLFEEAEKENLPQEEVVEEPQTPEKS